MDKKKKFLTAEDILQAADIPTEAVHVPEWGGWVMVKGLNGEERDEFEASVVDQRGKKVKVRLRNLRARLVAMCVVNPEDGSRLFTDDRIRDLGQKSAAALDRVFKVAQRLSGLSDDDVSELIEDFDDGQNGDSTSD